MAKRGKNPDLPEGMGRMIEESWGLFKEFQGSPEGKEAMVTEQGQRILGLIEQDEGACIAIFGSGMVSGIQATMEGLQQAHLLADTEERMRRTPLSKRPRA